MTSSGAAESGSPGDVGQLPGDVGGLHGRPTAEELVDAVAGFLRDVVMPAVDEPLRHQARIAAHVMDILARELQFGPAQDRAHRERLAALGFAGDAALSAAIRGGDLDGSTALRAALTEDTIDRLRVANPGWINPPVA